VGSGLVLVEDRGMNSLGGEDRLRGTVLLLMNLIWEDNTVLAGVLMKNAADREGMVKVS
jgi:hypothetical protein